jgi:hypothetical protein
MIDHQLDPALLSTVAELIRNKVRERLAFWDKASSGANQAHCRGQNDHVFVRWSSIEADSASFGSVSTEQSAEFEVFRLKASLDIGLNGFKPTSEADETRDDASSTFESAWLSVALRLSQLNAVQIMSDMGGYSRERLPSIQLFGDRESSVELGNFTVKDLEGARSSTDDDWLEGKVYWKLSFPLRLAIRRIGIDETRVGIIDIEFDRPGEDVVVTPFK